MNATDTLTAIAKDTSKVDGKFKKGYMEKWEGVGKFSTASELDFPRGLCVCPNGDIAVTDLGDFGYSTGVNIFGRTGKFKFCFKNDLRSVWDIDTTLDERYVITGREEVQFYDAEGNLLTTTPIYDSNDKPVRPRNVCVDPMGKIIVGTFSDAVSILDPDGLFLSKFTTNHNLWPKGLTATSSQQIAMSFSSGDGLQLVDYFGNHPRVILPPEDVEKWHPYFLCCSQQDELFVCSQEYPAAIYRCSTSGEFLGCVTTSVSDPMGLALSKDGEELYVADHVPNDTSIKIFRRP